MDLTPDQIQKLESLGVRPLSTTPPKNTRPSLIPLISISGLTLISFGSLILFKSQDSANSNQLQITDYRLPVTSPSPTQVPKSIQHYLLTSQQYFSQALQLQQSCTGGPTCPPSQPTIISLLNQSILSATDSIKEFPQDYRGYYQRSRIFQSLAGSKPELINQAISDLSSAEKLNPDSAEITRDLASMYAKKGDAAQTLAYLTQTVVLEPTKAQNFYDLARLQQQTGLIPQALQTYTTLLPLITDLDQKTQVENEKLALEKLVSQSSSDSKQLPITDYRLPITSPSPTIHLQDNPPIIQADSGLPIGTGLIIAAPETSKSINVENLTDTNSFSGQTTLPSATKEINLQNKNLAPSSQVYLSVIKGGKHQSLRVISKTNTSFTVGLDSPIPEPIEFKWWIIN
ncbi:MAG: hypothetical protein WC841_04245 [Candidatus Shapirobacteria bacterium]|jgi:tetratricopeptide (TPR) repeat protein